MKVVILFLGMGLQEIFAVVISIGFFLLVFLAMRAFFLWYWKVNIIIENQERQIDLLAKLVRERGVSSTYEGNPADIAEKVRKYDEMTKRSEG